MPAKSFSKTILQISNKSRSLGWEGADMGGLEGIAGRRDMVEFSREESMAECIYS